MIGFRGASRSYSLRYEAGFALECKAICLWLTAPERTLLARVTARHGDASDADAAVVQAQAALVGAKVPPRQWTTIDAGGTTQKTRAAARAALESVLGALGDGTGKPKPL